MSFSGWRGGGWGRDGSQDRKRQFSVTKYSNNKRHRDEEEQRKSVTTKVVANVFKVSFPKNNSSCTWYMYSVVVTDVKIEKDEQGNAVLDAHGNKSYLEVPRRQLLEGNSSQEKANIASTPLTRRILLECQDSLLKLGKFMVTDGSATAYAPERLGDASLAVNESGPELVHYVAVKPDYDKNHPDYDHGKTFHYKVEFTKVVEVPFSCIDNKLGFDDSIVTRDHLVRGYNMTLSNALCKWLKAFGRSPKSFYFSAEESSGLRRGENMGTVVPLLGLKISAHEVARSLRLISSFNTTCVTREFDKSQGRIPLLQTRPSGKSGTVFGFEIENIEQNIPENKRADLKQAFQKKRFVVFYEFGRSCQLKKRQSSHLFPNKTVFRIGDNESFIFEPDKFTFKIGDQPTTVAKYMKDRYDVQLKYEKLPLIRTRSNEYFPLEFLYQASDILKGSDFSEAQQNEQKNIALGFHQKHSGIKSIDLIQAKLEAFINTSTCTDLLSRMNLKVESEPYQVDAKVLNPPQLDYGGNTQPTVSDGSWSDNRCSFYQASTLNSTAVLDLSNGKIPIRVSDEQRLVRAATSNILRKFQRCGGNVSGGIDQDVPIVGRNRDAGQIMEYKELTRLYTQTIQTAWMHYGFCFVDGLITHMPHAECSRHEFHLPSRGEYGKNGIILTELKGSSSVYPLFGRSSLLKEGRDVASHNITVPKGNALGIPHGVYEARIGCKDTNGRWRDLFLPREGSVRASERMFKLVGQSGHAEVCQQKLENLGCVVVPIETLLLNPESTCMGLQVNCPSLILVYFPRRDSQLYTMIKLLSSIDRGTQTQVVDLGSYLNKTNQRQNIALGIAKKINAKLSQKSETAWEIHDQRKQAETLIIGLSSSSEPGGEMAKMVVVGSAHLNNSGLRMSHQATIEPKNALISGESVRIIAKTLIDQFTACNGQRRPKRLIVYRSSGQDGQFAEMVTQEVKSLRDFEIDLTYVVAQSNVEVRFAPRRESTWRKTNVPSGTVVDDPSFLSINSAGWEGDSALFDFFLVAQGGLKGTSRPVYYRVLCNETKMKQEELEYLTYELSYRYATASKAPRMVSVLQYSARLANQLVSCIRYLFWQSRGDEQQPFVEHGEVGRRGPFLREAREGDGGPTQSEDARACVLPMQPLGTGRELNLKTMFYSHHAC